MPVAVNWVVLPVVTIFAEGVISILVRVGEAAPPPPPPPPQADIINAAATSKLKPVLREKKFIIRVNTFILSLAFRNAGG